MTLEPQHAIAQHIGRAQLFAQTVGDGSEVFADDKTFRALALQRQLPEEVVERIAQIGAFQSRGAVGHNEQADQPHDVIDAQRAGMAHVSAQQRGEGGIAGLGHGQRIGRRQGPDLPAFGEGVGRRADR